MPEQWNVTHNSPFLLAIDRGEFWQFSQEGNKFLKKSLLWSEVVQSGGVVLSVLNLEKFIGWQERNLLILLFVRL